MKAKSSCLAAAAGLNAVWVPLYWVEADSAVLDCEGICLARILRETWLVTGEDDDNVDCEIEGELYIMIKMMKKKNLFKRKINLEPNASASQVTQEWNRIKNWPEVEEARQLLLEAAKKDGQTINEKMLEELEECLQEGFNQERNQFITVHVY